MPAPIIPTVPSVAQLNARNFAVGAPQTTEGAYPGGGNNGENPTPTPPTPIQGTSAPQPAREPTVLSSGNITDNIIPQNHEALASLSNKGSSVGNDGNTYYADGSVHPPTDTTTSADKPLALPSGATDNGDGTYTSKGVTFNQETDPADRAINSNISTLKSNLDSGTKSQVDSIEQQYAGLRQMQAYINSQAQGARTAATITGGAERYSPGTATSIVGSQMTYGLQLISKLDADENAAIARAKSAQQTGNMQLMNSAIKEAQTIRANKTKAATQLNTALSKAHDALLKKSQQATMDSSISDIFTSGVTDPNDVLKALQDRGVTATADDVAKGIKNLTPKAGPKDAFKFTNAQSSKLLAAGLDASQLQALHDYYNGNGDSSALDNLTDTQKQNVHDVLNGPIKAAASSKTKTFTSGSHSYTSGDLSTVQTWINKTKGSDNYVNPNAYKQAFDAWTEDGGLAKDFLKNFPPKSYINPANTQLPAYLRSKTTSSSNSAADLQSQINNAFGGK